MSMYQVFKYSTDDYNPKVVTFGSKEEAFIYARDKSRLYDVEIFEVDEDGNMVDSFTADEFV